MHVSIQKKTALEAAECGTLCAELFIEALEARIGLKCTSQLEQGGFLHALDLETARIFNEVIKWRLAVSKINCPWTLQIDL